MNLSTTSKMEITAKPHHIIVKGSWKEIGFDLATIAKNEYDVKLLPYCSPRLW